MRGRVWAFTVGCVWGAVWASPAFAQVCRGTAPFGRVAGDYGFRAALVLPERGTGFAGDFTWAPSANLVLDLGAAFVSDVRDPFDNVDVWQFGGDGAFRFYAARDEEFPLDVCLATGFRFYVKSDLPDGYDENGFILPIGVSLGNDFPLGESRVRIAPYFNPMFAVQRRNRDRPAPQADQEETDGLFYVDFGVSFVFPRGWYLGLGIALGDGARVPSGDTEFRIRGGWVAGR